MVVVEIGQMGVMVHAEMTIPDLEAMKIAEEEALGDKDHFHALHLDNEAGPVLDLVKTIKITLLTLPLCQIGIS